MSAIVCVRVFTLCVCVYLCVSVCVLWVCVFTVCVYCVFMCKERRLTCRAWKLTSKVFHSDRFQTGASYFLNTVHIQCCFLQFLSLAFGSISFTVASAKKSPEWQWSHCASAIAGIVFLLLTHQVFRRRPGWGGEPRV